MLGHKVHVNGNFLSNMLEDDFLYLKKNLWDRTKIIRIHIRMLLTSLLLNVVYFKTANETLIFCNLINLTGEMKAERRFPYGSDL